MIKSRKVDKTGELQETLCGCFNDCSSCCMAIYCLPLANAKAWAGARDEECSCCHACVTPSAIWTRANLRRARGMDAGMCASMLTYSFCPICFTAQNLREIKVLNESVNSESKENNSESK